MNTLATFSPHQIKTLNTTVSMAEELVSNSYKMSTSQWLHQRYDVKTLAELAPEEIVHGPLAQIIRYEGQRNDRPLGSSTYDFYKICFQDHAVIATLAERPQIDFFPFTLYIIAHELIHIVRFSKFLQSFDASPEERNNEEARVHKRTHDILKATNVAGMDQVFEFYNEWGKMIEDMHNL
jgi:hypothetical protein